MRSGHTVRQTPDTLSSCHTQRVPKARKPRPAPESPKLPIAFDPANLAGRFKTQPNNTSLGTWTRETILSARDAQARGQFRTAARLGRAMASEPSIFAALVNRLAPHRGLPRTICREGLTGTPASILEEARANFATDTSTGLAPGVLADTFRLLAVHEYCVAQIEWIPRADGSRLDAFVTPFELDSCEWVEHERKVYAWTVEEGRVEVVHGDGRWVVFARSSEKPWANAALLPLATLWPELALGRRDRSQNAESHGDDKWIGYLPEGVPISSPEGVAMLAEMVELYQARRASLFPFGSKVERNEALGQNWQIFKELLDADSKDAQRILLGQDASVNNSGGNYIKAKELFGVRSDIVESDLHTVASCLSTGLLRPWSLVNFGRWDRLQYEWKIPDADEDARRGSIAERRAKLWEDIKAAREAGAIVDQAYVDALASEYGVSSPRLAAPAGVSQDAPTAPATITTPRKALTAA